MFTNIIYYQSVYEYDKYVKKAFPDRVLFSHKDKLIKFLSECEDPLLITDSILSDKIYNCKIIIVTGGTDKTINMRFLN